MLAARAAAAKDHHYVATYTWTKSSRGSQEVEVTIADDGTWRVDVEGGALGGTADVAIIGLADGQYQCALESSSDRACVKVASAAGTIPSSVDPLVEAPFTTWLDILTDQTVAVTVAIAEAIQDAPGTCFSVEPTTVTLAPPIGSSTVCYTDDGTMTAAEGTFGTVVLSGSLSDPPETITLPGTVTSRSALPTASVKASATSASPSS